MFKIIGAVANAGTKAAASATRAMEALDAEMNAAVVDEPDAAPGGAAEPAPGGGVAGGGAAADDDAGDGWDDDDNDDIDAALGQLGRRLDAAGAAEGDDDAAAAGGGGGGGGPAEPAEPAAAAEVPTAAVAAAAKPAVKGKVKAAAGWGGDEDEDGWGAVSQPSTRPKTRPKNLGAKSAYPPKSEANSPRVRALPPKKLGAKKLGGAGTGEASPAKLSPKKLAAKKAAGAGGRGGDTSQSPSPKALKLHGAAATGLGIAAASGRETELEAQLEAALAGKAAVQAKTKGLVEAAQGRNSTLQSQVCGRLSPALGPGGVTLSDIIAPSHPMCTRVSILMLCHHWQPCCSAAKATCRPMFFMFPSLGAKSAVYPQTRSLHVLLQRLISFERRVQRFNSSRKTRSVRRLKNSCGVRWCATNDNQRHYYRRRPTPFHRRPRGSPWPRRHPTRPRRLIASGGWYA